MPTAVFRLGLLVLLLSPYAVGAEDIKKPTDAGSWGSGGNTLTPFLEASVSHDDNILSDDLHKTDAIVTTLKPGLVWQLETGVSALKLAYSGNYGRYDGSSADNFNDHSVQANAIWEPVRSQHFDANAYRQDGHDDRGTLYSQGLATFLTEPDTYVRSGYGLGYGLGSASSTGRVTLGFTGTWTDYDASHTTVGSVSSATRDRQLQNVRLGYSHRLGPKTDFLVDVQQTVIAYDVTPIDPLSPDFDLSLDSSERALLVGVTWKESAATTGTIKAGRSKRHMDSSDRDDFSGTRWEIGIAWQPLSYSGFDLSSMRRTDETNGNFSEISGDFIETTAWQLGWKHAWSERLSSRVALGFVNSDFAGIDRSEDEVRQQLQLDYQMTRWLSLNGGYRHSERDTDFDPLFNLEYQREQIWLGVLLTL